MTHIYTPKVKRYVVYTSLRINRSQHAFGFLGTFKIRIYKALILPIATYGAETWTLRQADICRLDTSEMRCLRVIL